MHSSTATPDRTARHWILWSGACLLILGILLYGRTLRNGFVELDDPLLILENPAAQSFSVAHLKTIFSTYDPELYIPLTFVTYQFDATIGGLNPFVFHLHNLLEHVLNAWLVLILIYQLCKKRWMAVFASVLFLVHPIQTEAVLWAAARKDLLATTFFLLSIITYLKYRDASPDDRGGSRTAPTTYVLSVIFFLLGLLSKVTAISLPVVLLLIDWWQGRKITVQVLMEKLPYVVLSLIFGGVALYGKSAMQPVGIVTRVLTACASLAFSIGKIFLPIGLSPMYAYTGAITLTSPRFFLPLLGTMLLVALAFMVRRKRKAFTFAVAFALVTYAPSFGNLVKDGEYYLTSDRYSYIPMIAIVLLAAYGADALGCAITKRGSLRAARATVGILLSALIAGASILTVLDGGVWTDTLTLGHYITKVSPQARLGHLWYGNALRDDGHPDEAIAEYNTALAFLDDAQVYYDRALAYEEKDQTDLALQDYQKAIALQPVYPLAHINLGRLYYLAGKKAEAQKEFTAAAASAPQLAMPLYDLGVLEGEQKNFAKAVEYYRSALERDPTFSNARANLGVALLALGRTKEGITELRQTLKDDPENETATAALQKLE